MLLDYWWVGGLAALPIIFFVLRHVAKNKAKMVALKWLAVAERLVFQTGDSKIAYVTQKAYGLLPKRIKLFVPYALFSILVRELYDEIKYLIQETHRKLNN